MRLRTSFHLTSPPGRTNRNSSTISRRCSLNALLCVGCGDVQSRRDATRARHWSAVTRILSAASLLAALGTKAPHTPVDAAGARFGPKASEVGMRRPFPCQKLRATRRETAHSTSPLRFTSKCRLSKHSCRAVKHRRDFVPGCVARPCVARRNFERANVRAASMYQTSGVEH